MSDAKRAEKKVETIHIRLPASTLETLREVSAAEQRSISNLAALILGQWAERQRKRKKD
jgi:hypothetical protein